MINAYPWVVVVLVLRFQLHQKLVIKVCKFETYLGGLGCLFKGGKRLFRLVQKKTLFDIEIDTVAIRTRLPDTLGTLKKQQTQENTNVKFA